MEKNTLKKTKTKNPGNAIHLIDNTGLQNTCTDLIII